MADEGGNGGADAGGGHNVGGGQQPAGGVLSMAVDAGELPRFDTKGDPHNIAQRWTRWKRGFKLYLTARGVVQDEQKQALLLHTAGLDVQDIYYSLAGEGEKNYTDTLKLLDDHFLPNKNVPFERHLFRQISQKGDETMDQFVCRLRKQAAYCDFGANEDDHLRDQIIDKCHSCKLRRKLLERQGLLLGDVAQFSE